MYSPEYKALQEQFHRECPDYGVSGHRYADQILGLANSLKTKDILDWGSGKGTLQKALPFPIQQYDPFIPEHSARPVPADIVVSSDVLEHIEPEHLDAVLQDLYALTKKVLFLQVATRSAKKILPDGRNAHLIQQPANRWLLKLLPAFNIRQFQDMNGGFIAICTPIRGEEA